MQTRLVSGGIALGDGRGFITCEGMLVRVTWATSLKNDDQTQGSMHSLLHRYLAQIRSEANLAQWGPVGWGVPALAYLDRLRRFVDGISKRTTPTGVN